MAITRIGFALTDEAIDTFVLECPVPLEADDITPQMSKAEWLQEWIWQRIFKEAESGKKKDAASKVTLDSNSITKEAI